jgi:hypothetical protein
LFRYQKKNTKPCQKSIFNRQFRRTHHDTQHRDPFLNPLAAIQVSMSLHTEGQSIIH